MAKFSLGANDPAKEDFSLRYAPSWFRSWKPSKVALTALGALSAMALWSESGSFALTSGFGNAALGFLLSCLICAVVSVPIGYYIARHNLDIDLLTRGAGFGYLGSTITSLVYATFTIIYLAFEGAIMAQAVTLLTRIDIHLSYVLVSLAMIPLVVYGMKFSSKLQAWTSPIWAALTIAAIVAVLTSPHAIDHMTSFGNAKAKAAGIDGIMPLVIFGVLSANLSLASQIGEQGDYLRFMPDRTARNKRSWWAAMLFGGPGFVLIALVAWFGGLLLSGFAAQSIGEGQANVPVQMFDQAFGRIFGHSEFTLVLAALFVILSQVKINVMNAYSGSLSWSNFFSRILHRHPGRVVWLLLQIGIGLVVMELGVFDAITMVLAIYSNVAIAWIGCLTSDLVINKKLLKISPPVIEFRRAYLYNFNPVGFCSMLIAATVAIVAHFGVFGKVLADSSALVSLVLALLLPPIVAMLTKGKYYLARQPEALGDATRVCVRCDEEFEPVDLAGCPFLGGVICSLCCSTHGECHDMCKKGTVDLGLPAVAAAGTATP
ncbi:MAG TPA: histidine kinase [Amycolatopsis sp.]|nr:histidine kinase [Amycolatopsis sp.]